MLSWFLSFDCATKSFAWSLLRVDLDSTLDGRTLAAAKTAADVTAAADALLRSARQRFVFQAGSAVDLAPGIPDKNVGLVDRIRRMKRYVDAVVIPAVRGAAGCPAPGSGHLRVLIEYQMGQNANSNRIADALVLMFVDDDVALIRPALKNKLSFGTPETTLGTYRARYASRWSANKMHSLACFHHLSEAFGWADRLPVLKKALNTDLADTVTQVAGLFAFGDPKKEFF